VLQVLGLIRSVRNTFALVNRTPPEVLSLIPDHWEDSERDEASITLTHVCRGWREIFISRPSLWTRLNCKSPEKTRVYIERSKISPLEICLASKHIQNHCEEALLLVVPHVGRVKTISASSRAHPASAALIQALVKQFSHPVPLLEKLSIDLLCNTTPILPSTLFGRNLSPLRELSMAGVLMPLSWGNLENLTIFDLSHIPRREISLTYLLDFFESAPRLSEVRLQHSIPESSDALPERIVSLPSLKKLKINAQPAHSILLDHLSIPSGASVVLEFTFSDARSPIPIYVPNALNNLHNLSHISAVNVCFGLERRAMQFNGPSGELYVLGKWRCEGAAPHTGTTRLLRFLHRFNTSRCQWVGVTHYNSQPDLSSPATTWATYQFLLPMETFGSSRWLGATISLSFSA